ncbi:hypothetical protein PHMEG_00018916 [Phytophthora megakarya]|uniref:Origin recognition complex subunit 3 N-terminal domain-containing protein n=1 Tax=Phytophthora megakarya TaxID=4795 RepID=A0A225VTP1_9STRA|nr:hypothetical protein PHMEG_00018916 [Phytophthora megakarya]
MEAAAFSTGVSIQYPYGRSAANSTLNHHNEKVEYPFPFPASRKTSSDRQYRADTEAYSACQELAYHFACEKTRQAVQELLRKNNDTRYTQVLRFFEKYCSREEGNATTASPSGRRLKDPNLPVLFPEFHAFPTAAVIAGTDATSSDLWIDPLTQKLRRTFPICLVAPRDVSTARKFIEWLAARVAKLCAAKLREEKWLEDLVDKFDLLPLDKPPVAVGSARRITRNQAKVGVVDDKRNDEDEEHSDFSFYDSSSGSDESDDEYDFKKKKRRIASVAYGRWTMTKLLMTIQHNIDDLLAPSSGDISREWVDMLGELVQDRLQEALKLVRMVQHKEDEMVPQIIACFDEAVAWLQHKIEKCQDTAVKLLNVAPASNSNYSTTAHIGSTEMALAMMLKRVFCQYESFLKECTLDREVVRNRKKSVKQEIFKLTNHYMVKSDKPEVFTHMPAQSTFPQRSFLLLCIEQLEAFSQQVLSDFLGIWTHFVQQQQENCNTNDRRCTLGFVIGVASATSPALRRLDLTVTNRFELQFFSLVDSRKCFDDVLEALVVNAKLPLSLSGEVLRAIARRQHRLPSVPRLLLALRFLLFTHFRRCPWSFLGLAVDDLSSSGESPILVAASCTPLPHRVAGWVKRYRKRMYSINTKSFQNRETRERPVESDVILAPWLLPCSPLELADLASRTIPSETPGNEDWMSVLEAAALKERRRQARWRMGWRCFRSACSWLNICIDGADEKDHDKQEQMAVVHLALALEGRLGQAPRFTQVLQQLETCERWVVLVAMIEDWKSSFRASGLNDDEEGDLETTLSELATLCAYARSQKPPLKMQVALRQELVDVFTTRLITALLHPPIPGITPPAEALVSSWCVLTDAHVLDKRLRFEYHDNLREVLEEAGIGDKIRTSNDGDEASWVHDVGLAYLFYKESASASLSLRDWYESFSSELEQESKSAAATKSKKKGEDCEIQ